MTTTTASDTASDPKAATLQMVRAEVNAREFQRWMGMKRLQDADHAMHCLLTEGFGRDLAPKPFRLIMPRDGGQGVLYGYGAADSDALRQAADTFADPLQMRVLPLSSINSKPMPSEWQAGKRLGFETRIRPVVRLHKDPSKVSPALLRHFKAGGTRPGKECDAFLWEAITYPENGGMQRSREEVYAQWLAGQLERHGGAQLEPGQTKLVAFQRTRSFRKQHSRYSEGPDVVMQGNLTITDPDAFAGLLARGVGRHRAYGYGMLLLRPPGPAIGP